MGFNVALKAGIENFGQFGKLIGTGKNNGIRVFESLVGEKRVLTSVGKDNTVLKTVTTTRNFCPNQSVLNEFLEKGCDLRYVKFKLTEVETRNGDKFMNLRGIGNDGTTEYQRLVKESANGETEQLSWIGYLIRRLSGGKVQSLNFAKRYFGSELNYSHTSRLGDGGYEHFNFHIADPAKKLHIEPDVTMTGYITSPVKNVKINGYMDSAKTYVRPDGVKGTRTSRIPVYEEMDYEGIPLSNEIRLSGTYHANFNKNNLPICIDKNVDRNTYSNVFQNIYRYVEKLRGAKVTD